MIPECQWRSDVQATYTYLTRYYTILSTAADTKCSTHIQLALGIEPALKTLQQIGVCIIHFEAAIEALLPENRRVFRTPDASGGQNVSGNSDAESNWLASPFLAQLGKGRLASMKAICDASSVNEVVRMLNGAPLGREPLIKRNYAWNFRSTLRGKKAIEFRKPPAALEASSAIQWAELTVAFIARSILVPYPAWSSVTYAANTEGLYTFIELILALGNGIYVPEFLQKLWEGKWAASTQPVPCLRGSEMSSVIQARFKSLMEIDKMQHGSKRTA